MKTISSICDKQLSSMQEEKEYICEYIFGPFHYIKLKETIISTKHTCEFCGGTQHYAPIMYPAVSGERAWLCANALCAVNNGKTKVKATTTPPTLRCALEWPLFCEINGIGDMHHDVKFEKIEQAPGKIAYLKNFVIKPAGILHMEGKKGTGKTYAAMAVCEKFTRFNTSCIFTTQKQMFNNWLATFKDGNVSNYIDRVLTCNLLVIDDFGIKENSASFMDFFMEIINTRMQWTDRGTIITTNLDLKTLSDFCGEPLSDRIKTGQRFLFEGESRRGNAVL